MPAVSGSPTQLAASVTTLANLGGLPDDAFKNGDLAYVESTRATYQLDRTAALTPSSRAVDAFSGNGQWLFFKSSDSWASETVWYINSDTGDDENEGTSATTALETYAELRARLSFGPAFSCVVYVTGTELDQIVIDGSYPVDSKIHILGVPTVSASGTFGVVTAKSEAGNTLVNIVSATLAANAGKLLRVTSGTAGNIGSTSVVMKDLGGGSARCTNFIKKATTAFETGVTAVVPVLGDGFEVLTCPITTHPYINAGPCEWAIEFLYIEPDYSNPLLWSYSNDFAIMGFGVFWTCKFNKYLELYGDGTIYINGCGFPGGGGDFSYVDLYDACRAVFQAGGIIGDGGLASAAIYAWSPTNRVTFDYSFCIQNSILSMSRGGFPTFINVAAFDCTTNAFYIGNGGTMTFQGSSYGYVFGSANVAVPFYFGSNTVGQYTDKNRITIATTGAAIFSFNGTTKIIATIPYSDATYYCRLISA
jgi:hypothetical protein